MNIPVAHKVLVACLLILSWASDTFGQGASTKKAQQLFEQAQALAKGHDYERAVTKMRAAVELSPRNDYYLQLLAHFENQIGDFANALKHVRQAIALNGQEGYHYAVAANAALGNLDLDLTRGYFKKVIDFGPAKVGQGNFDDARRMAAALADQQFTLRWDLDPAKAVLQDGFIAIPVPTTDLSCQTSTFEVTGVKNHKTVRRDGNDILLIVPDGMKRFQLTAKVALKPSTYKSQFAKELGAALPEEARIYLGSSERIDPKNPRFVKIANEVKKKGTVATVKNIVYWMKKHIRYKDEDFETVEEVLERGYGECGGWSALFVALCRASGVPAREVWGMTNLDNIPNSRGGHAWAEFYLAGVGWVPVEPQHPERLGLTPLEYVRMHHYDVNGRRQSPGPIRASATMASIGGNSAKFERLPR